MPTLSSLRSGDGVLRHLSDAFCHRVGWCPDARVMNVKACGDVGSALRVGNPMVKSPGPSGAGRSRDPRDLYERTQRGSLVIGAVAAAAILILASLYLFGIIWVTVFVLAILLAVLACFSTLTVTVSEKTLRIRFGPVGLIRKSWPLADIASVTAVTNPWYYGWGIRWTPHGLLYNVSGYRAVEVRLLSGKQFRIGTADPDALRTAIEQARVVK